MRVYDRDLIRGGHYGQRPRVPRLKAEHMAAPTNAAYVKKILANSEPSTHGTKRTCGARLSMSASLIGHLRSSTFRLSTTAVSMSLTGSRFSSESAPRPFHYGIRGRGGTIFGSALPLHQRHVQADIRTHLIHRPARDIFPRLGGTRVFSYCN